MCKDFSSFACIMLASVALVKSSHMAKFRFKGQQNKLQPQCGLTFPLYRLTENNVSNLSPWALEERGCNILWGVFMCMYISMYMCIDQSILFHFFFNNMIPVVESYPSSLTYQLYDFGKCPQPLHPPVFSLPHGIKNSMLSHRFKN